MKFCFNLDRHFQNYCFTPEALRRLGQLVDLKPDTPDKLTPEWLRAQAADCDGMIGGWGSLPIDGPLLDAAPDLRLVLYSAGTIKGVATPEMWRRGVRITSAANVNGVPVAEFSLGLILMCFRDVWAQQHRFRTLGRAGWEQHPPVVSYYGSTVGIIGMGNVGKSLLDLLAPFQFKKLIHSFYPFDAGTAAGVEMVAIDELMSRSDAVVLLAPNLPEYARMIDARRLALMRDGAFFINPARGALVDETALLAELQSGRLTACLDVTDPEPPVEGSPFYSLPNCILTPHVAGSTASECLRLGDQVVRELELFLAGKPFENEITEDLLRVIG